MKHLKEPTANSTSGTSFHSVEIEATLSQLKQVLGEPDYSPNDGEDKVNFEWERETKRGNVFTVYDWKEYRPIGEGEVISWHIGGFKLSDTKDAKEEIEQALKNISSFNKLKTNK